MKHKFIASESNPNLCHVCRFPFGHWMTAHEAIEETPDERLRKRLLIEAEALTTELRLPNWEGCTVAEIIARLNDTWENAEPEADANAVVSETKR